MTDYRQSLRGLLRRKSILRGVFTLTSGRKSDYYLDCKLTTLDPQGSVLTGYTILKLLEAHSVRADAIGGLTMGADPIVTAVAAVSHLEGKPLPGFLIRKERKAHGRQRQIEGIDSRAVSKVVIVDEVCTTGESTLEAIRIAEEARLEVVAVVSLVDREEGGSDQLRENYLYLPVFTAKELLEDNGEGQGGSSKTAEDTCQRAAGDPGSA